MHTVKNSSITTKHLWFLVVIDEFLTVSLYQPNEFISWYSYACFNTKITLFSRNIL